MTDLNYEIQAGREKGLKICGIDEVGRGPLAGPVVTCAAFIPLNFPEELGHRIRDSKKLSRKQREALFPDLTAACIYALGQASVAEIDTINIFQATMTAMRRAAVDLEQKLGCPLDLALIDGNKAPKLTCATQTIVKGDDKSLSIAAASIIAKVTRDLLMDELALAYPGYGWDKNAGYGTALHMEALRRLGATPHHRQSFAPVRAVLTRAEAA